MSLFAGLKTVKKTAQPDTPTAAPTVKVNSEKKAESRAGEGIATVGDGGAGWKLKALKRAQVKAKDSGQSLDQVVFEQHGTSVQDLAVAAQGALNYQRPQHRSVKGKPAPRPGDWTCPGCRSSVFASKANCFKCGEAKPAMKDQPPRGKFGSWYDDLDGDGEQGVVQSSARESSKGGLRVGRESKDADVLKQFHRKLQGSVVLAGLGKGEAGGGGGNDRGGGDYGGRGRGGGGDYGGGEPRHSQGGQQQQQKKRPRDDNDDSDDRHHGRQAEGKRDNKERPKHQQQQQRGSGGGGCGAAARGVGDDDKGAEARLSDNDDRQKQRRREGGKGSSTAASSSSAVSAAAAASSEADRALLASLLRGDRPQPPTPNPAPPSASASSSPQPPSSAASGPPSTTTITAVSAAPIGGASRGTAANTTTSAAASTTHGTSSNFDAAAALRAKLLGGNNKPRAAAGGIGSSISSLVATATTSTSTTTTTTSQQQHGSEVVAALDGKGRRLMTLVEKGEGNNNNNGAEAVKEDFRQGKWRGKATGKASARSAAASEEDMDVNAMAAFEREGGEDMDETFARNIVRLGGRYAGTEQSAKKRDGAGADEEDEVDTSLFQSAGHRVTALKLQEMERAKAVHEHKKAMATLHSHPFSVENPAFREDLVVARSPHAMVMLAIPLRHALAPSQQCIIVPIQQVASTRACSEEVAEELGNFKQSLRRMWGSQGMGCLFLETASRSGSGRHWGHWTCVPVPLEVEEDAPLYFKQALDECDEEWATHKASIDLGAGGLRKAIPNGFPYFAVEWAQAGGAVHVIEDSEKFDELFGEGVVAGMLAVPPPRHKADGFGGGSAGVSDERAAAESIRGMYRPFDWGEH